MRRSCDAHHVCDGGDQRRIRRDIGRPRTASGRPVRPGARHRRRHSRSAAPATPTSSCGQRANQPAPEPGLRAGGQFGGGAGGDQPAAVEDVDPVGQPLDVGQVVAREEDRDPGRPQVRDDVAGRGPGLRVHPGRRLVQDRHLGPADQGHGERESLALAAGQAPDRGPGHRVEARRGPPAHRRRAATDGSGRTGAIVSRGPGSRVEAAALQHDPDPRPEAPAHRSAGRRRGRVTDPAVGRGGSPR